jgi:hypothetical protein
MKRRKALINIAIGTGSVALLPFCTTHPYITYSQLPFSKSQFDLILLLSNLLVPSQDDTFPTPEDRPTFLLTMLQDMLTKEEIVTFAEGVQKFEQLQPDFNQSTTPIAVVGTLIEQEDAVGAALQTIKRFSLRHFMTSQVYMEEVQGYEFIPGRYEGCVIKN